MQLAIDTSTDISSIALSNQGDVVAELTWHCGKNHTRQLLPNLVHLLHHTLVADGHRPEYGPISRAGYMACIEADGTMRKHHAVINEF